MGLGDEVMLLGSARARGRKVRVVDARGRSRWHELWRGSPWIVQPGEAGAFPELRDGSGCRPYVDYARTTPQRWAYTTWRCGQAPAFGFAIEPDPRAAGRILVEPEIKSKASPNKQWGRDRWQQLVEAAPHLRWAQLCPPGQPAIDRVERIETPTFTHALGALAACAAAVLPEGGLHHAAAALGKRSVVLFGGMTSPRQTGYDIHRNLAIDDPEALGWRIPHPACERAWAQITPHLVLQSLETVL